MDAKLHAIVFNCVVEYSNITAFVQNLGHFEMMRLAALDDQTCATQLENIASLIIGTGEGFLESVTLRDSHSEVINYPVPPTHPSDMVKLQGRDIAMLVEQHKE